MSMNRRSEKTALLLLGVMMVFGGLDAAEGGQIACAALWAVAREFKAARKTVAAVCEKSGFKIRPCQLGAF